MKIFSILVWLSIAFFSVSLFAQTTRDLWVAPGFVGIGIPDTTSIHNAVVFQISSQGTSLPQGLLFPQVTTYERDSMLVWYGSLPDGLTIFNRDTRCLEMFRADSLKWQQLCFGSSLINVPQLLPDPCDGVDSVLYASQWYSVGAIGNQCWFLENLNVGNVINQYSNQVDNGIIEKFCFNNDPAWCDLYGGRYQFQELCNYTPTTPNDSQGICPLGWHIPSGNEWHTLELHYSSGLGCPYPRGGGSCAFSGDSLMIGIFDSKLSGYKTGGGFVLNPQQERYWSLRGGNSASAYFFGLIYGSSGVHMDLEGKTNGFSCRCVKD